MKSTTRAIVSLLLAVSILMPCAISAAVVSGNGYRDPVVFTVSSADTEPDTDITVTVSIAGGYSANALTVFVTYDASQMELVGRLSRGEVWNEILDLGGTVMQKINNPVGTIGVTAVSHDEFSATGLLFSAVFHVTADAGPDPMPLVLTVSQFTRDEIGGTPEPIPYTVVNGVVTITQQESPGLRGDVNCDGIVDFDDVTLLNAYLLNAASLSEDGLVNANVNGDNKISSADVVALNKLILGGN